MLYRHRQRYIFNDMAFFYFLVHVVVYKTNNNKWYTSLLTGKNLEYLSNIIFPTIDFFYLLSRFNCIIFNTNQANLPWSIVKIISCRKTFLETLFNNKNKENPNEQSIHLFSFSSKNARRKANEANTLDTIKHMARSLTTIYEVLRTMTSLFLFCSLIRFFVGKDDIANLPSPLLLQVNNVL